MDFDMAASREAERGAALTGDGVDIAARVAGLRAERQWTLQETARRTGVAFSTLSKIERGELSPTITTLTKIARGLGMTLSRLLEVPRPATGIARRSITRGSDGARSATSACDNTLLCGDLSARRMIPIRTRVRARDLAAYDEWARYDAEIFLTVLSGTLILHSQSYAPTRLAAGDSIYYDALDGHLWTSEGEADAEVLWLYSE
ncbi:helix-turn-helix domain-containing protein [Falsirhodobacter halotolerans]|uniref:helix-turn-helix domain-containing protein n=1 Tax=Falsirhodobacter halotolerans TaxID=1146892 RepID=UPI001FD4607C|nr:XRE family transcriptional regulator [Falsirhodobacter halotolerans]MCJ8141010.1 XRE family transcriptional regulator [Falsirhodobacter halotolerans]